MTRSVDAEVLCCSVGAAIKEHPPLEKLVRNYLLARMSRKAHAFTPSAKRSYPILKIGQGVMRLHPQRKQMLFEYDAQAFPSVLLQERLLVTQKDYIEGIVVCSI